MDFFKKLETKAGVEIAKRNCCHEAFSLPNDNINLFKSEKLYPVIDFFQKCQEKNSKNMLYLRFASQVRFIMILIF